MEHGYDLHDIAFDSIGYDVRRSDNDKFPGPLYSTPPPDARRYGQALDRGSDARNDALCRRRVLVSDALKNIVEATEIPLCVFDAPPRHRRFRSSSYRRSASSSETEWPLSSSAIPSSISAICHSLRAI